MIHRRSLLLLVALAFVNGCSKPNLPTKPPFHLAFTASAEIDGKPYPIEFTWSEENFVAWNEGFGWHTDWKSSHRSFVRILDADYAVVVWLPTVVNKELETFRPTVALFDRRTPRFLRSYPHLTSGENRDGHFRLTRLKIERSTNSFPLKPMTKEDESLKSEIAARQYGYLYGMRFDKEQWGRSRELQQSLSGLKGITPLGKRAAGPRETSAVWCAFTDFNIGTAIPEKMDHHPFGFQFRGDSWAPLPYERVYWYSERLAEGSAPIWISYRGQFIDQQQNELFFDESTQQLFAVWKLELEPLNGR